MNFDPFAIGMGDSSGALGVATTTHNLGVEMRIEAPPSVMDTPPPPHHAPSVEAARAVARLPWHQRVFTKLCWWMSAKLKEIGSAKVPRV